MTMLSLIIPAYNECKRLPPYLSSIVTYFTHRPFVDYEIIIIDDGSADETSATIAGCLPACSRLSLLLHPRNLGKGAALRTGILAARGDWLLLADADGATPIKEEQKLRQAIEGGAASAIGSRLLETGKSDLERFWYRRFSGRIFAAITRFLFHLPVRDTQCGFKMFRRETALQVLPYCRETGYLFDLEILLWTHRLGYPIAEVPVIWRDVPGSKVCLGRDGLRMLRGLGRLRHSLRKCGRYLPKPTIPSLPVGR